MAWYAYLAYFFAGVFLANGVPHFIHGISGDRFSTPFSKPPGSGDSSPLVNVIWGAVNFLIASVLIFKVDHFTFGFNLTTGMVGLGALVTAVGLAISFGRARGE